MILAFFASFIIARVKGWNFSVFYTAVFCDIIISHLKELKFFSIVLPPMFSLKYFHCYFGQIGSQVLFLSYP